MKYNLDILSGYYQMSPRGAYDGQWEQATITAYHITEKANAEAILSNGLQAQACKATEFGGYREEAVYLFSARQDAYDANMHKFLFDGGSDLVVIKVSIPQTHYRHLTDDGIFNTSAICSDGSYPTGMQYLEDIPAAWLRLEK